MDGESQHRMVPAGAAEMARRLGGAADTPLGQAVVAAVAHLHALVHETRPTPDDLRRVLDFLTDVGQASDLRRQEWVLLADVLGVSTLVEDLNAPVAEGATPATLPGPFYRPDAPELPDGADLSRDGRGERLAVTGRVTGAGGLPVAGAEVEVWQANGEGRYENQEPDLQPEFNLRGRFRTDADGRFRFRSVKPRGYPLPGDGPVGRLMAALGYRLERPAHLHFRVSAPGHATLVTHVFDRDDPAIGQDALFGVKPGLLAEFRPEADTAPGSRSWTLDVTLRLAPLGSAGRSGI